MRLLVTALAVAFQFVILSASTASLLTDICPGDPTVTVETCRGLDSVSDPVRFDASCMLEQTGCGAGGHLCCRYCGTNGISCTDPPDCNTACIELGVEYDLPIQPSPPRKLGTPEGTGFTTNDNNETHLVLQCQKLCAEDEECTHFSVMDIGHIWHNEEEEEEEGSIYEPSCHLFEIPPGSAILRLADQDSISGPQDCFAIESVVTSPGCVPACMNGSISDYGYVNVSSTTRDSMALPATSARACYAWCRQRSDCDYTNYDIVHQSCFLLKETADTGLVRMDGFEAGCLNENCRRGVDLYKEGNPSTWPPLLNLFHQNTHEIPERSHLSDANFGTSSQPSALETLWDAQSDEFWEGNKTGSEVDHFTIQFSSKTYVGGIALFFGQKALVERNIPPLLSGNWTPQHITVKYKNDENDWEEILSADGNTQMMFERHFALVHSDEFTVEMASTPTEEPSRVYGVHLYGVPEACFHTMGAFKCAEPFTHGPFSGGLSVCKDACASDSSCLCATFTMTSQCNVGGGPYGMTADIMSTSFVKGPPFSEASSVDMMLIANQSARIGDTAIFQAAFLDDHQCRTVGPVNETVRSAVTEVTVETAQAWGAKTDYVECPNSQMRFARCALQTSSQSACEALGCCWDASADDCYSVDPLWDLTGTYRLTSEAGNVEIEITHDRENNLIIGPSVELGGLFNAIPLSYVSSDVSTPLTMRGLETPDTELHLVLDAGGGYVKASRAEMEVEYMGQTYTLTRMLNVSASGSHVIGELGDFSSLKDAAQQVSVDTSLSDPVVFYGVHRPANSKANTGSTRPRTLAVLGPHAAKSAPPQQNWHFFAAAEEPSCATPDYVGTRVPWMILEKGSYLLPNPGRHKMDMMHVGTFTIPADYVIGQTEHKYQHPGWHRVVFPKSFPLTSEVIVIVTVLAYTHSNNYVAARVKDVSPYGFLASLEDDSHGIMDDLRRKGDITIGYLAIEWPGDVKVPVSIGRLVGMKRMYPADGDDEMRFDFPRRFDKDKWFGFASYGTYMEAVSKTMKGLSTTGTRLYLETNDNHECYKVI
ncbi:unnamed protein product [Vitrella brassicaformis CCMP3155]|uniref:P-type domain-containing protein n=1 Tax=Vitrella brassicaformis (strain CCMP3155) TaxID=1169540 RepID=A0A0G4GZ89_VITBC|nr:unnamed protein product [Vitrella brassicaformis CCMP3155]|eukprot:CEM36396.1 unnamed protein product [Vitrella brassicaformis CCMP3155]